MDPFYCTVGLPFSILPAPWQEHTGCSGLLHSTIQAWWVHLTIQVCTKASGPKSCSISVRLKCILTMKHKDRRIFPLKYLLLSLSLTVTSSISKLWEKSDYLHPRHNLEEQNTPHSMTFIPLIVLSYKWLHSTRGKKGVCSVFIFSWRALKWWDFKRITGFNFLISCLSFVF